MASGDWKNVVLGFDIHGTITQGVAGSISLLTMTAANNAWCARFMADDSGDIQSVKVAFFSATTPGTMTCRIETIDATTGKPSGTLYDASASKQFTPAVGVNTITFDTLPTTGLTPGVEYAIVLIKDNAATACQLWARVNTSSALPSTCLTATDGSTRSNFSEIANTVPVGVIVDENGNHRVPGLSPVFNFGQFNVYGADRVAAYKITTTNTLSVKAVTSVANQIIARAGTPVGDLRVRVLDASNNVVSGMTWTIDKDSMTNANLRGLYLPTNGLVTLPPGSYRIAADSASSVNTGNSFGFKYCELIHESAQPNNWCFSSSVNASTSFTWTDTTTYAMPVGFALDDVQGGGGLLTRRSYSGGYQ